jgi:hypothetical protein
MYDILFYLLFILLISDHYHLNVPLFKKIQDYKVQDPEQQQAGSKASDP